MDTTSLTNHPNVGQLIATERQRQNISQEDLAERVGMSQEWVTKVETGRIGQPKLRSLRKVADALGMSFDELVLAAGYATGSAGAAKIAEATPDDDAFPPHLRASFLRLKELSPENQEKAAAYLDDLYTLDNFQNTRNASRRTRRSTKDE